MASITFGLAAEAGASVDSLGEGYTPIGTLHPRPASEIEASNWSIGAETMDRDYTIYQNWKEYLGPLGVKKARIQSGWAKTERTKGKYDWAWLDEIILDMRKQGVEPWVCLSYGNPIYKGGGETGLGGGMPKSPEALAAWDRFVGAMVDRYKDQVDEWEIWNEPGLRGKNPEDAYADLLMRTATIIREKQPNATIIGFAMAGMKLSWVEAVLDRVKSAGKLDLIDQLSYHPYTYNPDESYPTVGKLRRLVQSYSPHITLRQGENGCPSQKGSFGAIANHDWTEETQAKWALRRMLGDLGRDIPSSYFAICDMQYPSRRNYKGLLAINDDKTVHHAKVGYRAVQNLTALFDSSLSRIKDFEAGIKAAEGLGEYSVFAYKTPKGQPVVTIWCRDDVPGKRPELVPIQVALPGLQFKNPVRIDLLTGRIDAIDSKLYDASREGTTFKGIPAYDSPIVLAERKWLEEAGRLQALRN